MDATHQETGRMVYIKEVKTDSEELRIAQLLTQEDWISDPRNRCVPVVKIFQDHGDPQTSYIVMPFLRPVNNPPFEFVKEIIDFVDQILEVYLHCLKLVGIFKQNIQGLVFLHEKGVAHRYDPLAYSHL